MSTPIRHDEITATDWQLKLGEIGGIVEGLDDVDQCIRIILLTPRGSVAFRPDFGCGLWNYIDWPITEARPRIIREVLAAIATWERRVEVTSVQVDLDEDPSAVLLTIERRLRGAAGVEGVTQLRIAA